MTKIYFIRHAEADNSVRDGRARPLTPKGEADRALVTDFLSDKHIDIVASSPYKRAIDTIKPFADKFGHDIKLYEGFREARSSSDWQRDTDYWGMLERMATNFNYKLTDGENLSEVRERNLTALDAVLDKYAGKNIVIGTHGTALFTILSHYDDAFGIDAYKAMLPLMPWVAQLDFIGKNCIGMTKTDLFEPRDAAREEVFTVRASPAGALSAYRFVVIFARYKGKWLYCRARGRDVYETAGGHIEEGETPLEAARRELYEETGATRYEITHAFDYRAYVPWRYSNGAAFFAEIHELGDMPGYEMEEVRLFEDIPDRMRFPQILPELFEVMARYAARIM